MKQTTASFLTEQIKDAIMAGSYSEGMQLKQDDIARSFGVSKIPIREALVQLESEGFVIAHPGRGVFVSKLSKEDANELYLLRLACEPVLLEQSIKNANAMMLAKANSFLHALQADKLSPAEWHALDREFHSTLYSCAELPRMHQLVRSTHDNLARYFVIYESLGESFHQTSDDEHDQIYHFAKEGKIAKAKEILKQHLLRSFKALSKALEEKNIVSA